MFSRKLFVAAVLAVIGAGAIVETAAREPDLIYERYGERRAVFQDWLAACRPGGYCSVLAYNGVGPEAVGVDAHAARLEAVVVGVAPDRGGRGGVLHGRAHEAPPTGREAT
ncbi:MAG: hypothetical protein AAFW88_13170, partial [Pseudomonadota bacterium]